MIHVPGIMPVNHIDKHSGDVLLLNTDIIRMGHIRELRTKFIYEMPVFRLEHIYTHRNKLIQTLYID
jgi:hypothetical protein